MIEEHANFIGGEWRPALAEHVFEISAPGERNRPLARFPRSSSRDFEDAIFACASAEPAWQDLAVEARRAIVDRALDALALDPDPDDLVAECVGLAPDELARHRARLARALESRTFRARPAGYYAGAGISAVQMHWSELWMAPVQHAFTALLAGRAVLLFSDPHVPFIAERMARVLDGAGLPRGVLALVHDDRDTCLDAALDDARIDTLHASGPRARVREIERCAHRHQARELRAARATQAEAHGVSERHDHHEVPPAPVMSTRRRARFGAGLDDRRGPELELSLLRNASYRVTHDTDPAQAAAEIIERAFGRAESLSGQLASSIGRVVCHERQFSKFSAELLDQLERHPDAGEPLPAREAAELDHVRRACELGLDEGATLVCSRWGSPSRNGNAHLDASRADLASESDPALRAPPPAPSRDRRAEAILWPAVFTNVEEHMRLAWLGRPAPVLCLMRVPSDERGAVLAEEIDRDPLAEDLSAPTDAIGDPA